MVQVLDRTEINEFHFIAPFEVLPSVFERGILSRLASRNLDPPSIADPKVLAIRETKRVPGGARLLAYANLYFDARNAMLSTRRNQWDTIGIVRVSPDVLDRPGAVISDRNAASGSVRFHASPDGLQYLDATEVFAEWWNTDWDAKQKRMAELLVPGIVRPEELRGVHVRNAECHTRLKAVLAEVPIAITPHLFFQGSPP